MPRPVSRERVRLRYEPVRDCVSPALPLCNSGRKGQNSTAAPLDSLLSCFHQTRFPPDMPVVNVCGLQACMIRAREKNVLRPVSGSGRTPLSFSYPVKRLFVERSVAGHAPSFYSAELCYTAATHPEPSCAATNARTPFSRSSGNGRNSRRSGSMRHRTGIRCSRGNVFARVRVSRAKSRPVVSRHPPDDA